MSGTPTLPAKPAENVRQAALRLTAGIAAATVSDHGYHDDIETVIRAALASGATQPSDAQIEEAKELVSFYRKAVIEALSGGAEEIATMQTAQRRLVAALAATEPETMTGCSGCGEGVTTFCRGKVEKCPLGLAPLPVREPHPAWCIGGCCNPGDPNSAHPMPPTESEPSPSDDSYPFYELRFIMRVLGHTGRAPEQDWKTAQGMAMEIFKRWHGEKLSALAAAAPAESDPASLSPIDYDKDMDRVYIPLPGGWEIQTQGKGSSFRLCDTKTGDRRMLNPANQPIADALASGATQPSEPVLWASPEQVAAFTSDPAGEHGHYLPMRRKPAGKFTQPLYLATPPTRSEPAKWIDDPHDIEQGQMLNPAWLAFHNTTASEVHRQQQTPSALASLPPHPTGGTE